MFCFGIGEFFIYQSKRHDLLDTQTASYATVLRKLYSLQKTKMNIPFTILDIITFSWFSVMSVKLVSFIYTSDARAFINLIG